jgi:ketosteroid isomerase-like protein
MRTLSLMLLLACLGAKLSNEQTAYDPDSEAKLISLERVEKVQASETKDLRTLNAILDANFINVDPEGRIENKSDVLEHIQAINSLQCEVEAIRVKIHGDTAIVTGLYRMKGEERGQLFVRRGRLVDTWLYKNDGWVAIASLSTPN